MGEREKEKQYTQTKTYCVLIEYMVYKLTTYIRN